MPKGVKRQKWAFKRILKDGCRDALVLWGDILIDGHNRLCDFTQTSKKEKQAEYQESVMQKFAEPISPVTTRQYRSADFC